MRSWCSAKRLARHERGASMVEFSLVAMVLFALVGGIIDFAFAFFQWNAAAKALQAGVRMAAVSNPVARGLGTWRFQNLIPGDPMPSFTITCRGTSPSTCNCTGTCITSSLPYDAAAMNRIVEGRPVAPQEDPCGPAGPTGLPGMCDVFWPITPQNVIVTYSQGTSLGFAGRPGGPVPTITIELTGLQYEFIFLRALIPAGSMMMPPMATSVTGEDLSACGAASC
jgi:Flp pilus assembly pilin Flp